MDISIDYVKMCSAAVEIQNRELKTGDYYAVLSDSRQGPLSTFFLKGMPPDFSNQPYIFIPRQDQLSEMLFENAAQMIEKFWDMFEQAIIRKNTWQVIEGWDSSIEILLLRMVMLKKFNKSWNGMEWVIA